MAISKIKFDPKTKVKNEDFFGRSIYIVGSSELGPTNIPTMISSLGELYSTFGTSGNLIDAYKQIKQSSSNNNITVVKTTGTHSVLHLNVNKKNSDIIEDGLVFKAKDSSHIYNNIKMSIKSDSILFNFPIELGGGYKEYYYSDYTILGLLERAINNDTKAGTNFVYAQCNVSSATLIVGSIDTVNPPVIYMYGGDNGILYSKAQLYFCLEETYSMLEGEPVDILIPVNALMDDLCPDEIIYGVDQYDSLFYQEDRDYLNLKLDDGRKASYYEQLLFYCIKQLRFGFITHGIMGYNLTLDSGLYNNVGAFINSVVEASLIINRTNLELQPYWFLISAVVGDLKFDGGVIANGYTAYAGTVASLNIASNTTNKPVGTTVMLFNEFKNQDLSSLADLGVVTFRYSPLQECVVVMNGVTTAPVDSDFHFLCNVRMIQLTMSFLKAVFEDYIGEDVQALMGNNLLSDNIQTLLDYLKGNSIITGYSVTVTRDDNVGEITLDVSLKTVFMIESVNTSGTLQY